MLLKITAAIFGSVGVMFAASAQDQPNAKIGAYDDRPFTCGALFSVLVEAHSNDKDRQVYNHFKSRFERSFQQAKSNIRGAGGDETDAKLKMQERIDFVVRFLDQKRPETADLLSSCERS